LKVSGINVPYKVITIEATDKQASNELIIQFKGSVKINNNLTFGFVGDIFIEPSLIIAQKLTDGSEISEPRYCLIIRKKINGDGRPLNWFLELLLLSNHHFLSITVYSVNY